ASIPGRTSSGSFLRAAITHYLANNPGGTGNDRLQEILRNVVGIDIHPVAVTIAKATYVLALGKHINAARKPIHIPIYLADSLFLPRDIEANLLEQISGIEIAFGPKKEQRRIVMPEILVHHPDLFDDAIAACAQVAEDHAKSSAETLQSLRNHLASVAPNLENLQGGDQIINALWDFTEKLADLIRSRKDSIWSFIIRNSYRPAMLREGFDFIIGNPPWLSYRFVADPDYQDEIKRRAVTLYKIAPKKGKLFTQMELATVFLAHSMATFATPKGRLAFVMPRSVLNADQHQNLIERKYSPDAKFRLTGYWDLRRVQPLFEVPSCVLFADFSANPGDPSDKVKVLEWEGKLPVRDLSWARAEKSLSSTKKTGTVIYLGGRSALSTEKGDEAKSAPSPYQTKFKQGATIVPRNFYFVRMDDLPNPVDPSAQYWAFTDPEQAKQAKKPYTDVNLSGLVEGRFIYSTALSRHLLPFTLMKPTLVLLPLEAKHGALTIQTSEQLSKGGFREFGKWMRKAEGIWRDKRGSKADKQSLHERLDYQRELTRQSFLDKHLVLYNHSGTNVSATYFDREPQSPPFIVDVKLYWAAFDTKEEAIYLATILNSEAVNAAIKPFQSMGLLGERDVHKKVLDLPIPIFDPENLLHQKLLLIGSEAHQKAAIALNDPSFPSGGALARQRKFIRTQIQPLLEQIDILVHALLGKGK
ncbi:MAG: SAM-dependent DNA methyltransferase, partial [Acidobacteria bacterium]|nr:SAM-dependent DNA methyltransferase [Acidobacteriota bacterium]